MMDKGRAENKSKAFSPKRALHYKKRLVYLSAYMENAGNEKKKASKRAFIAVGVTCIMGWLFSYLATNVFRDYAAGLFMWLPFVMGATSTMIYGYKNTSRRLKLFNVSILTLIVFCLGLLFYAWEGVICLVMALPIGVFFTWVGHLVGYAIVKYRLNDAPVGIILLFVSVPFLMAFENKNKGEEGLRSVTTSIEINASAQQVWKNVISFPQLKEPTEFIFKAGIAYPINATIDGIGVGAIRHCNFSTGGFVEPITSWNEPVLLRFSVSDQPEPMKEMSPYNIHPNHLHGYWVSKQGQFKLTSLANGHTLLEGTTWYINKIKPGFYWTLWSDFIVHKIHKRVLEHIKTQSESNARI